MTIFVLIESGDQYLKTDSLGVAFSLSLAFEKERKGKLKYFDARLFAAFVLSVTNRIKHF
jgi:hypothetical protein